MKRKLFALLAAISVAAMALVGCGESTSTKTPDGKEVINETNNIVGNWKVNLNEEGSENSIDISIIYSFNDNGKGSIEALGEKVDFEYKVNGDNLTMTVTYDGETESETGKFTVNKDKLTITSKDGEVTTLDRVK